MNQDPMSGVAPLNAATQPPSDEASRKPMIGWREWISFPAWNLSYLKAKVDTGARTSSLHVEDLEWFEEDGTPWVRFSINPWQRSSDDAVRARARVVETRDVRSSSGSVDHRPVIAAEIMVAGESLTAEITLTNRDEMGFRMLIGREALRGRFIVDPEISYVGGRPTRKVRRKNRGKS